MSCYMHDTNTPLNNVRTWSPKEKLINIKRGAMNKPEKPMLAIYKPKLFSLKYTPPLAHVYLIFDTGFTLQSKLTWEPSM